ncbi:hypothetical protein [Cytobacillus gottheilii]|uniref:hypothetical protein n=1 Tax=Cytobacillus gottheilii TaxID=859144 RepID=UPI001C5706C2|nr:hypothetical protein [Cytobacillus gottheilii]
MLITATKENTLDKELLVDLLQKRLKWAEGHLQAFSPESLKYIYKNVLQGHMVAKAKANTDGYIIKFTVPKQIVEAMGYRYGDYFDIKVNLDRREVVLLTEGENKVRLGRSNLVTLKYSFAEKRLLKGNDDMLLILKGDKLILKSFSYMQ